MLTALFYTLVLMLSTFFIFLSERYKNKNVKFVFCCISFLIVFIPSAIRWDVGSDFYSYVLLFEEMHAGYNYEYGYKWINILVKEFGGGVQLVFLLHSFIFCFISYLSYPKKYGYLVHFSFYGWFYFFSFNGIRQAVVIALALYSIFKIIDNKKTPAILGAIAGVLFHYSSFLIVLLLVVPKKIMANIFKYRFALPVLVTGLIATLFFGGLVFNFVVYNLPGVLSVRYERYATDTNFAGAQMGSGLTLLFLIFISSVNVYLFNRARYLNEYKMQILLVLSILCALSAALTFNIYIVSRVKDLFAVVLPLSVYFVRLYAPSKVFRVYWPAVILVATFVLYFNMAYRSSSATGDLNLNPYQTCYQSETGCRW